MRTRLLAAWVVCSLGMAGAASAAPINVWSTSFDVGYFENIGPFTYNTLSVTFGGGTITPAEALPGFGSNYFRNDTSGTTTFAASGLGSHTELHLSFDLAFLDSWDGLDGTITPDILFLTLDGSPFLQLTATNASGSAANYGPGVLTAPVANYAQNPFWTDAVVHYDLVIPHSAADFALAINFGGAGFQGGSDESWGIDNFSLAADTVPEPMTLSLLGAGLGGLAIRRRRRLSKS